MAPREFTIGESLSWTVVFDDYPAGDGWDLMYYFRGPGQGFDAAGTPDGDTFTVAVGTAATGVCSPGVYNWQAYVTRGGERILVQSGQSTAIEGLWNLDTDHEVDSRSPAKQILDVIDARISGDVSKGVLEYTIGDRQLQRYSLRELRDLREYYGAIVAREERRKSANGGLFKNYGVKFRRP